MENFSFFEFFPKYPNLKKIDKFPSLNPYSNENFFQSIFLKKEFNSLKVTKKEEFKKDERILMNHQKLIARFFSSHTPYVGLLVFHEMGSGKTCSAIAATEQIRSEGGFKQAIYISSKLLSENFLHELLYVCTKKDKYKFEETENVNLSKKQQRIRERKLVSDFYKFGKNFTYFKFAQTLSTLTNQQIKKIYNNSIIIIDEIHNLPNIVSEGKNDENKKVKQNSYKIIKNFLHTVEGSKVLLLSGTPMHDVVSEIVSVMNLILPLKDQLPEKKIFLKTFFEKDGEELYKLTDLGKSRLRKAFKGRVSYLRAATSKIKKIYKGIPLDLKINEKYETFKVQENVMSIFQSEHYKKAYEMEKKQNLESKKNQGIFIDSRQASQFVFPDGSFGSKGFLKYVIKKKASIFGTKQKGSRYVLNKELNNILKGSDEEKLKNLKKFSSKFASSITIILQAIKEKKLIFVYNEFVEGGGLILFSLILKKFGFTRVVNQKPKSSEFMKYILLTGKTKNTTQLLSYFNLEENKDGSLINVVLGSKAVSEGLSFKNIQVELIQTPWFNYSRIDQAVARGYRVGSHHDLKEKRVELNVYQQVSLPRGNFFSIDLYMYKISQEKDISIKRVERLIKESAFDCALTYDRNRVFGLNGSRDCDYASCDYDCRGIPSKYYKKKN